jgi:hypothetical protein
MAFTSHVRCEESSQSGVTYQAVCALAFTNRLTEAGELKFSGARMLATLASFINVIALQIVHQFEITPKAFANFSPRLERSDNLGD